MNLDKRKNACARGVGDTCDAPRRPSIKIPDGTRARRRRLPNGSHAPKPHPGPARPIKEKNGQRLDVVLPARLHRELSIMRVIIVLVCCALAVVSAEGDSVERFEARLASAMDKLNGEDTIGIYGDMLSLEKVAVEEADAANEATETDPLVRRIDNFLKSRRLRLRLPNDGSSADYFGRALGEKDVGVELRGLVHGASEGELGRIAIRVL